MATWHWGEFLKEMFNTLAELGTKLCFNWLLQSAENDTSNHQIAQKPNRIERQINRSSTIWIARSHTD